MSFDRVARIYDQLAAVVFGEEWKRVQLAPVDYLNSCNDVLIVGGGTGQLLTSLDQPKVTYVEFSPKMVALAKGRVSRAEIVFQTADFLTWQSEDRFDAVLLPFFLDVFKEEQVGLIVNKCQHLLKKEGTLLVLDFQPASKFQNFLTRWMYLFFKVMAGLPGNKLLPLNELILRKGFDQSSKTSFLNGWVFYGKYRCAKRLA